MDLARSRFSDFISVPHDERISHENRTCGIFGNYLCNDFRNSYRKINSQIVTMDLEKGAFSALNILIVIWPAVFLYEMMEFAGVFQSIKQMLQKKHRMNW